MVYKVHGTIEILYFIKSKGIMITLLECKKSDQFRYFILNRTLIK